MKKERRWLKAVIAATATDVPAMPWARGQRRKPVTLRAKPAKTAMAAR